MFDIKLTKRNTFLVLLGIFLVGLIFRLFYFSEITFGYDQARDAFMAMDIFQRDPFKITGPNSDIFGLNHGVLYWYLISPIYYLTQGNVYLVKLFLSLLNLSGVFLVFYISRKITKNNYVGLFSAFIYATSFEAVQYSRWISNPSLAIITTLLTFYSFWLLLNKKTQGLYLFLICWPLSVHFEFFLVYHLFIFLGLIGYRFYQKDIKVNPLKLILSTGISFLLFSPFILEQAKYKCRGIVALFSFIKQDKNIVRSFVTNFLNFIDKIVNSFYFNVFGLNLFISGILFFIVIFISFILVKRKLVEKKVILFLFILIFSPIILFSFEKLYANFVTLGNIFGVIILFSLVSYKFYS